MVPETVGFAFVAHMNPMAGLYASFVGGLIAAVTGGRPGMITGGAGSLAVVSLALVVSHGPDYLFLALMVMGLIQIAAGILKLGRLIDFVPHPVMLGFVNGLAIVIFLAQLRQIPWQSTSIVPTLFIIFITVILCVFAPKISKIVPAALLAIGVATVLEIVLKLPVTRVGDLASLRGGLPPLHFPSVPVTAQSLAIVLPYSLTLAAVGLTESLLTQKLVDEVCRENSSPDRECVGQGLANLGSGLVGGMGACAMIGQTVINLDSGGRSRISGISESLSILAFMVFASSVVGAVPSAALVGVMFVVVFKTFSWISLRDLGRIPRSDAVVIVVVTLVTVFRDLASGVLVGVLLSSLAFIFNVSKLISVSREDSTGGASYRVRGLLFFGSVGFFLSSFNVEQDPSNVQIDFSSCPVFGYSGTEALVRLESRYKRAGKNLVIIGAKA
jgi:SulP family sulfate permease